MLPNHILLSVVSQKVTSGLDGSKIERELCFTYRFKDALDVTLKDTAQSMIDLGIVPLVFLFWMCLSRFY